ncbi:hypothetical protein [Chitinophaga polysaccharea]|uniref:hypothetical protein n=1 Tax=Chitinophaga polysaccharea TaxID=1293035 RepID=UPI00115A63EE|nr:hypothetical protein [Chitinophaga polysaccharea]
MLILNNLGVNEIILGSAIQSVSPISPFSSQDRELFIPDPNPESWFKYNGETSSISNGEKVISAQSIFLSKNANQKINRIIIHPDTNSTNELIEDFLTSIYGAPMTTAGGMGNLGGVTNYTIFYFISEDKSSQIIYFKTFSSDFGIDEISFRFLNDEDALFNYKLVFRSWANLK